MANVYRIALYPGDGIGPEVVDATRVVLDAVERHDGGFRLEYRAVRLGHGLLRSARPGRARRLPRPRSVASTRSFSAPSAGRRGCPTTSRWRRSSECGRRSISMPACDRRARSPAFLTRFAPSTRSISSSCARTPKASTSTTAAWPPLARHMKSRSSRPCTRVAASNGFCVSRSTSPARAGAGSR